MSYKRKAYIKPPVVLTTTNPKGYNNQTNEHTTQKDCMNISHKQLLTKKDINKKRCNDHMRYKQLLTNKDVIITCDTNNY